MEESGIFVKIDVPYFIKHLNQRSPMNNFNINRRRFLQGAAATLALTSLGAHGMDIINPPNTFRVGLIGTGWYGKSDLFRLIQVAPVEVVSICDVDKKMLQGAADMTAQRQKS